MMTRCVGIVVCVLLLCGVVSADVENHIVSVPSKSGSTLYFSSSQRYPIWFLTVTTDPDYEHVPGTQSPTTGPWVMGNVSKSICSWFCFVSENESELFFQQEFGGGLEFVGERVGGGGGGGEPPSWTLTGERTEYKILPQMQTVVMGEVAVFRAIADYTAKYSSENNPVFSGWKIGNSAGSWPQEEGTTVSISHDKAGMYKVEGWADGDEGVTDSAVLHITEPEVQLIKVKTKHGKGPDLPDGRVCVNAQDEYKRAKWQISIKPKKDKDGNDYTASVSSTASGNGTCQVTFAGEGGSSPSALKSGEGFWAVGGAGVGDYEITLTHNDSASTTDVDGERAFKFVFEDESIASGPYPADNAYHDIDISTTGNDDYTIEMKALLWGYSAEPAPEDLPHSELDSHVEQKYKLLTEPSDLFSGNVHCATTVTTKQQGILQAYGFLAAGWFGGYSAKAMWQASCDLTGIENGGSVGGTLHSASAPVGILYPFDIHYVDGHTDAAVYPDATYTVGSEVKLTSWYLAEVDRSGALPGWARGQHGDGISDTGSSEYPCYQYGITKSFGEFVIVK